MEYSIHIIVNVRESSIATSQLYLRFREVIKKIFLSGWRQLWQTCLFQYLFDNQFKQFLGHFSAPCFSAVGSFSP
jgi:hypothetical protein